MMNANTNIDILINFGNSIKGFRRRKKLSQLNMAIDIGIDVKTLRMIENGKVNARCKTVFAILNYMGGKYIDID